MWTEISQMSYLIEDLIILQSKTNMNDALKNHAYLWAKQNDILMLLCEKMKLHTRIAKASFILKFGSRLRSCVTTYPQWIVRFNENSTQQTLEMVKILWKLKLLDNWYLVGVNKSTILLIARSNLLAFCGLHIFSMIFIKDLDGKTKLDSSSTVSQCLWQSSFNA